jgi:hypothetical protein
MLNYSHSEFQYILVTGSLKISVDQGELRPSSASCKIEAILVTPRDLVPPKVVGCTHFQHLQHAHNNGMCVRDNIFPNI